MKNVSIIGSTGSIGTQTLSVIREHPDLFSVVALSCGRNIKLLADEIREFHPAVVSVEREEDAEKLKELLLDCQIPKIGFGEEGLLEVSTFPSTDILVSGIVGMRGIKPTVAAIKAKKDIALANKETLVCAGHIIMPLAKEYGVSILPVDSEHSAIFQSLQGNEGNRIEKIILTASGGPFFGMSEDDLKRVTVDDALKNPNWDMGAKVTIDSASMVNKGLEVMEAHWLFDVPIDDIKVHVHRQSILHSAVQFSDGAVMAQLGTPDMRLPIQYALTYPNREELSGKKLDLFEIRALTFEEPDPLVFKGLKLAIDVGRAGGNLPTAFNAADEEAVKLFLERKIGFLEIADIIEKAVDETEFISSPTLSEIEETGEATKERIRKGFL
ncbi:MAG: 1-deoxy-D-xylulose-5-phosphate reductoisomerase [Lachnospiraceae bacterium]|nr:1-deoxy-D-xylulose-5-phosphate reductoisomerase [Lachnospiraceae bacterium]